MALALNKHILEAGYNFLRATAPFDGWNLPDGEDVVFRAMRTRNEYGDYSMVNGQHRIRVSAAQHGHTNTLLATIAHEMIHLHIQHNGVRDTSVHGQVFKKLAAKVCKIHGFEPGIF